MVKQKNHTGRNATVKDHVNGIKKAKSYPSTSLAGVSVRVDDELTCADPTNHQ